MNDNLKRIEHLLLSPDGAGPLSYAEEKSCFVSAGGTRAYPLIDGVVRLLPETAPSVSQQATDLHYKHSLRIYDTILKRKNLLAKLYFRMVWGLDAEFDEHINWCLDALPEDFKGVLLDVPAGNALFTAEKYLRMKSTLILAVDYSLPMLLEARKRLSAQGIENVVYIQADVGALPLADRSVDAVLSLNGFHAFPDKKRALKEITRTVRPGGLFSCCTYISEQRAFSDFMVRAVYAPLHTFTPPFPNLGQALESFGESFELRTSVCRSFIFFTSKRS